MTKFSASQNTTVKPRSIDVDLIRAVAECPENFFFNVQGIIKDNAEAVSKNSLFFHYKCSSNAAVTNNDRTLQKIKLDEHGSALTTRPLLNNEIFTVRIDKLGTKYSYGIGIGLTTHAPGTFEIPNHMDVLKTGKWMFYIKALYYNSSSVTYGYDLNNVKVGQRVGVMRSKSGTIHLFVDGIDQGPAMSNIPDNVYGALDLFGNLLKATIVDV
ncbi:hypothetical protein J437_LFUL006116 [Ladona fulva]|uniref:NHR domain-containing protein n=1 Tax=Ladona fulva TaxID=123851 RepID=A0A8K0K805_LADFU|nr:hypothetical protein J437_LFUL006116 [Ladona fulva]